MLYGRYISNQFSRYKKYPFGLSDRDYDYCGGGLGVPPLIFYAVRKPSWDMHTEAEKKELPHY